MNKLIYPLITSVLLLTAATCFALDPHEIVKKGDEVANAPKDAHILSTMILIEGDGKQSERKSEMYQKGTEKRLVQFLSPADQKGIGFLTLPDDIMYLYLPAFHKVRQIASHVKNQNFAGTDLTYEDLSEFELAEAHRVELIDETGEEWVIKLFPNDTEGKDYTYLHIHYRKDNNYPVLVEYFNSSGAVWKTIERTELQKISGYWTAKKLEVKNIEKNHSTINRIDKVEYDLGLDDSIFTKRYLMRTR
ncbi:MAG: outer membrane lipoprotein-sorting protein [Spirochaetes bacterium]|nr:outer membrane lipoprotein-sorting protein [Spirochaetota bacterium]